VVAGDSFLLPDAAIQVLTVLEGATQVVLETFLWMNNSNNDCGFLQTIQYVQNIDNTTVNNFNLLTLMQSTLNDVVNSVASIAAQVLNIQQTLDDQLTLAIQQGLSQPATAIPNLAFELPASVGGNLDSTPIGVQEVVNSAVTAVATSGEPMNPAASRYLALGNSALTSGQYVQAYTDFHTAYLDAL
jgi:hypothetical protein